MQKKNKTKSQGSRAGAGLHCSAAGCAARPPRCIRGCTGWQGQGAGGAQGAEVGTGCWDRPISLGICSWGWNGFTPAAEGLGFPCCICTVCGEGRGCDQGHRLRRWQSGDWWVRGTLPHCLSSCPTHCTLAAPSLPPGPCPTAPTPVPPCPALAPCVGGRIGPQTPIPMAGPAASHGAPPSNWVPTSLCPHPAPPVPQFPHQSSDLPAPGEYTGCWGR